MSNNLPGEKSKTKAYSIERLINVPTFLSGKGSFISQTYISAVE